MGHRIGRRTRIDIQVVEVDGKPLDFLFGEDLAIYLSGRFANLFDLPVAFF
jgi:hypothetical protein